MDTLNTIVPLASKDFVAFVTSLKHFAKCRTGKNFLRKKYQNLIPAKYKATFFYM